MNDDTAEIEANVDNAYQAGIRAGRKLERERIAAAIETHGDDVWWRYSSDFYVAIDEAADIARTEPS